jgi:protein-S-isoprenylcysteine O-methyltransferase Ste14
MMVLTIYMLSAFLLLVAAFVVFRIFVRGDYRRKGRLTLFSALLEWVIFSLWGTFTWLDLPPDWPPSYVSPVLKTIGWILVVVGAVGLFSTIATFGFRRAHGLEVNVLKQSGLYRLTRNPQILVCSLVVIGYAMLWPSWHTLGWVVLFAVIAHMMVLTEEEHLRTVYGEEYVRYCERVPRYLGFRGKSKKDAA